MIGRSTWEIANNIGTVIGYSRWSEICGSCGPVNVKNIVPFVLSRCLEKARTVGSFNNYQMLRSHVPRTSHRITYLELTRNMFYYSLFIARYHAGKCAVSHVEGSLKGKIQGTYRISRLQGHGA